MENDSYNPQQTVAVVKKLVDRDERVRLVSTLGTVTNLAVLPFLAQRGVPVINPAGGHVNLNKPKDKNVFGILPLYSEIGESMADYALNKLGAKKIAIFFQNDQFGKDQRDGAAEYLKKRTCSRRPRRATCRADVDVSAQVSRAHGSRIRTRSCSPYSQARRAVREGGAEARLEAEIVGHNTMADPVVLDLAGGRARRHLREPDDGGRSDGHAGGEAGQRDSRQILSKTKPGYYPYLGMAGAQHFRRGAKRAGRTSRAPKLIKALEDMAIRDRPRAAARLERHLSWRATKFGYAKWEGGELKVLQGW